MNTRELTTVDVVDALVRCDGEANARKLVVTVNESREPTAHVTKKDVNRILYRSGFFSRVDTEETPPRWRLIEAE